MAEKKDNNIGCLIIFIIYIIGNIIYALNSYSDDEFAEIGQGIMGIVALVITILIFKYFFKNNDNNDTTTTRKMIIVVVGKYF